MNWLRFYFIVKKIEWQVFVAKLHMETVIIIPIPKCDEKILYVVQKYFECTYHGFYLIDTVDDWRLIIKY